MKSGGPDTISSEAKEMWIVWWSAIKRQQLHAVADRGGCRVAGSDPTRAGLGMCTRRSGWGR